MTTQTTTLLSFLNDLKEARIHYRLGHYRSDAITVEVSVPGERWEIEFGDDGAVEVEVFRSDGEIHDASVLAALIDKNAG